MKHAIVRACAFAAITAMMPLAARAADTSPIRIGFLSSFSGPVAGISTELYDGFKLAMTQAGYKMGGRTIEVIQADDQEKPDIARQAADKLIQSDRIQILTGFNLSNMLIAVTKPSLDAGVFVISPNAGSSQFAGKGCNQNLFFVGHQNDALFNSVGTMLNERNVPNAYLLAPNYPAGRDMMNGFKRTYTGQIKGETYTPLGAMDYASTIAEIRAAHPAAVMTFMPGGPGINFLKQYAASGLNKDIPVYSGTGLVDEATLPAIGDAALGIRISANWNAQLDNPANKAFVADFIKAYGRSPSPFAATGYDTARAIGAALNAIDGRIEDKPAFRHAMEAAKFDSVRGKFVFNTNHFPIQSMYSVLIVNDAQGHAMPKLEGLIAADVKDIYAGDCVMPPA